MELVQQHNFPQSLQSFGGILHAFFPGQHAEQLQIAEQEFALAVAALVPRHAGIGSTVIFKIELPGPHRQTAAVLDPGFQLLKILTSAALTHGGNALDTLFHPASGFQHFPAGAAAAITIAIGDEDIIVHFLILIAFPTAHDGIGMQRAVIGGEELLHTLADSQRGDKVGEHPSSVDTFPHHGIVGDHVELVPGELGGHKVIDAGFLHDLGQRSGIAKHVGQPQHPVFLAEFLFEEPLAIEELAHQAFACTQVAVCFQPHTAFRLPAAFINALLDFGVQFRIPLFQKAVQNRLAGHKFILRVFFHQF